MWTSSRSPLSRISGSTGSTTGARSKRTYPGAGCLKLASWRRAPKMSRRASRLISSQTSNWIRTRTEPCSDLFWEVDADWAGVGTGMGAMTVEFAVSIKFQLSAISSSELRGAICGATDKAATVRPQCLCLLSQKAGRMGSGQVSLYLSIDCGRTLPRLVRGGASRPSQLSRAQQRRLRQAKLASTSEREQERRSGGDSSHGQAGSLHGLFDGRLVRPHPGIFGIVLRRGIKHREAFRGFGCFAEGHLENFGEVQGVAVGFLGNLLAATESVGDDEPVSRSPADGGQEFEFANGFRDLVFFLFEAERSGHAAASGSGRGEVDAHAHEHRLFGGHLHKGLVMAMPVDKRSARQVGKREILC